MNTGQERVIWEQSQGGVCVAERSSWCCRHFQSKLAQPLPVRASLDEERHQERKCIEGNTKVQIRNSSHGDALALEAKSILGSKEITGGENTFSSLSLDKAALGEFCTTVHTLA